MNQTIVSWYHICSTCAEAAMEDVMQYLLKSSSINFPGIWAPWTYASEYAQIDFTIDWSSPKMIK